MSKTIKKIAAVAAPIAGIATGNPFLAAAGGGLGGLAGGGGLKGALLGAAGGYAGAGGLGSVAGAPLAGGVGPTQGSGLLGSLTSGSGTLSSALRGIGQGVGNLAGSVGSGISSALPSGASSVSLPNVSGGNVLSNVFSGIQGTNAYKDMEKAQLGANRQALSAVSPFLATGQSANTRLSSLLGLSGGDNQDDILNQLRNTPGYQFQLDQGNRALDRAQAARGGFFSGQALKASQEFGQGLADQTYNDYVRNLAQQSNQGLGAAGGVADLYGTQGDIRANAIGARSDLLNKSLANILTPQNPYEEVYNG